jgi:hypothetical protein
VTHVPAAAGAIVIAIADGEVAEAAQGAVREAVTVAAIPAAVADAEEGRISSQ